MIDATAFHAKHHTVVGHIKEWLPQDLNLAGATILDFGCEHGIMALGMAMSLPQARIVGVDINDCHLELPAIAQRHLGTDQLPPNLSFERVEPTEKLSERMRADVVFAWSVFEHVNQTSCDEVASELCRTLNDGGYFFLQIAPLFYSAYGSHLGNLVSQPWAHLTMQHNLLRHAVFTAAKSSTPYRDEPDDNYARIKDASWSCYSTLNRMTADDVVALFERNGYTTVRELRLQGSEPAPDRLARIYARDVLETEQLVALFRKKEVEAAALAPGAQHPKGTSLWDRLGRSRTVVR